MGMLPVMEPLSCAGIARGPVWLWESPWVEEDQEASQLLLGRPGQGNGNLEGRLGGGVDPMGSRAHGPEGQYVRRMYDSGPGKLQKGKLPAMSMQAAGIGCAKRRQWTTG